jgi:DNA invertase Pin-like site-specific DNA recombinase
MAELVDLYIRISRVGGRENLISPEEQERDARAFAERRGLKIGEVFEDIDQSGGTLDRPALQTVLERILSGKSAGVVVAYLSRLSRETSQGLALIEQIREAGGDVYAPNLSDHTTADGRMLNTIQLAIDAGMRERAKEQIARSREAAIERGIPVSNRAPVGYLRDPKTRRYVVDEDIAPVVRQAFERRAAGAGPSEIGELLEGHGVQTSQGSSSWSRQAVKALLKSRVYLGEIRSGPYVNPSAHEPIVDLATWTAAQRTDSRPRRPEHGYLLSGILRCASCGYTLQGTTTSRGKRRYRCVGRHAGGRCPAPVSVYCDEVEAIVIEEAQLVFYRPREALVSPDLAPLEAALERAEQRLEQAQGTDVQDALGDAWPALLKERLIARDDAAAALGEARAKSPTKPTGFLWGETFGDLERAEQREVLRELFPAIALRPDKLLDFKPDVSRLSRRGFRRTPKLNPLIGPVAQRPSDGAADLDAEHDAKIEAAMRRRDPGQNPTG